MKITVDWHIHSRNSCDAAAMTVADLASEAPLRGITDFGLTDHVHSAHNLPDMEASRREYLAAEPGSRFRFGVEASCMSRWELDEIAKGDREAPVYGIRSGGPPGADLAIGLTDEDIARYGIEYVVGGVHWPMYVPQEREAVIRDYHRQYLFMAAHPLVTIVAHPWWWMGHWKDADGNYPTDPWLDDFGKIPASMHRELADAVKRHNKVVEINISANLLNPRYPPGFRYQYVEYIAELKAAGVTLTTGSDCHSPHYDTDFEAAAALLDSVGIRDEDLWRLPPREA